MARSISKLSARQVQSIKPSDKDVKLSDGGNLYFICRKTGSRSWVFRYKRLSTGKMTNAGLGAYPEISLSRAREIAAEYRQLVRKGLTLKSRRQQT